MERTRRSRADQHTRWEVRNGGDRIRRPARPLCPRAIRPLALTANLRRKALVVCGPTAAGKSALADTLAEDLSRACGAWATTLVVDSMQVYREIPLITNQVRERPAELTGIVSVAEEWTVASHKQRAETIISSLPAEVPFVLDSGTGMYLNAILLDIPLAPRVSPEIRTRAEKMAAGADNPRRAAREIELNMAGARERGSIWSGEPRYETTLVYIRPQRLDLDHKIRARSSRIVREGYQEAKELADSGVTLNPSVREAIGIKETLLYVSGHLSRKEAEETIATRTRKLARRQVRWFDKLARSLPKETSILIVEGSKELNIKHTIHGIIEA